MGMGPLQADRVLPILLVLALGVSQGCTADPAGDDPAESQWELQVSVEGPGRVSSSPEGIACPPTCLGSFVDADFVVLTAFPDPGSTFSGWSGDGIEGADGSWIVEESAAADDLDAGAAEVTAAFTAGSSGSREIVIIAIPPEGGDPGLFRFELGGAEEPVTVPVTFPDGERVATTGLGVTDDFLFFGGVSEDGNALLFDVWRSPLAGGEATKVTDLTTVTGFCVFPSGRVAVTTRDDGLLLQDDGGDFLSLASGRLNHPYCMEDESATVVDEFAETGTEIRIVEIDTAGNRTGRTSGHFDEFPITSADNTALFHIRTEPSAGGQVQSLREIDRADDAAQELTRFEPGVEVEPLEDLGPEGMLTLVDGELQRRREFFESLLESNWRVFRAKAVRIPPP